MKRRFSNLLCGACLLLIAIAAVCGGAGGLTLRESKALLSLGLVLGIGGIALDRRLQ